VRDGCDGVVYRQIPVSHHEMQVDDELEPDNTFCEVCGRADREDRLLLCDGCDLGSVFASFATRFMSRCCLASVHLVYGIIIVACHHAMHAERDISANPSVCTSVRPFIHLSHSGIVSKRRHIA